MSCLTPPVPIDATPEIIRNTAIEVIKASQAPDALVLSSILAAVSLACQNQINVERLPGLVGPCSLNVTILAESGERKSYVDSLVTKPFREFDEQQRERYKTESLRYQAVSKAWQIQHKAILSAIARAAKKGDDLEELTKQLEDIYSSKPQEPRCRKILVNDITAASYKYELRHAFASAGLFSDEAQLVVDSGLLRSLALQNKIWDGGTVHVDRRTSESFTIADARVTTSLMFQPDVFLKRFNEKDSEARRIGYLARTLIAYPLSTQGSRFIRHTTPILTHLPRFHQRISELLHRELSAIEAGTHERKTLRFSQDAQQFWIDNYNGIESHLSPGKYLSDIRDFGSKYAENIARIAALFHYFEDQEGDEISLDTLTRAISVGDWYVDEFKRLFAPPPPVLPLIRQDQADAMLLEEWLIQHFIKHRFDWVDKSYMERHVTRPIRPAVRLSPAINVLIQRGLLTNITVPPMPGRKPKIRYCLNLGYFDDMARRRSHILL